ncbi:MAG: hypothetical protein AMJ61_08295 [Desulfobacterales bacterium SG8_35_2]|jgi:hypothetical protein|nr:MAG: hypothetical protein AMJ61_08295 [Desulfobacterales bacterium SG8_35_2]
MFIKHITFVAVFVFSLVIFTAAGADETIPDCTRLDEKASGDLLKYSLDAEVNSPVFFADIRCGVRYRMDLCAMEMVSFDISARVYDFYTAEKIEIDKAYFWLEEKNKDAPILAFSSKESAEKYGMAKEDGMVLDYTDLTDKLLK